MYTFTLKRTELNFYHFRFASRMVNVKAIAILRWLPGRKYWCCLAGPNNGTIQGKALFIVNIHHIFYNLTLHCTFYEKKRIRRIRG